MHVKNKLLCLDARKLGQGREPKCDQFFIAVYEDVLGRAHGKSTLVDHKAKRVLVHDAPKAVRIKALETVTVQPMTGL